jgi:tRNA(Ile)-lysidine synthase
VTRAADLLAESGGRIPSGEIVVALSGGADSAVLAWLAVQAKSAEMVQAVHVNHGQPASPELESAARAIASRLGVRIRVVEVDVGTGASFENRARDARMDALLAAADSSQSVLIGHQRDDVVETVIAHLGRGAGARGLSGIAEKRGRLVRPLIDVDRSRVRAVATELELPFIDDPSNLDLSHQRNAIRSRVVPVLEDVLGEGAGARIARAARHLAADDAALEAEAAEVPVHNGYRGAVLVPAAPLTVVAQAVAARVVQRALRQLRPPYGGSAAEVATVLGVAAGEERRATLSHGFFVDREGALVALYPSADVASPLSPERIDVGKVDAVTYGPVRIHASPSGPGMAIGRDVVRIDASEPYVVRAASEGERLEIVGGTKLVRDAMAETGIPRRLRSEWPVVARDERIAWIAGSRLAPWAGADPATPTTMTLRMERIAL